MYQPIKIANAKEDSMRRFILKNHLLKGVVHKTENVVIQKIQEGKKSDKCFIIGNGNSLSVDSNNLVTFHDPCMMEFNPMLDEDYTVYVFYFTFEAAGLEEAAKDVANFVSDIWFNNDYLKIILVGHSKAGICALLTTKECACPTILVTISTPFYGTIVADKEKSERILKFRPLIFCYRKIFSNHNVDKDITPRSRLANPLPYAICEKHINIISSITKLSDCQDILDLMLLFMNWYMKIAGDGIVPTSSQSLTIVSGKRIRQIKIFSSHAHSLIDGLEITKNLI